PATPCGRPTGRPLRLATRRPRAASLSPCNASGLSTSWRQTYLQRLWDRGDYDGDRDTTTTTGPRRRSVQGSHAADERTPGDSRRVPGTQREPRRAVAAAAAVGRGGTGGPRRPDAFPGRLRPRRRHPDRRRLLPSRP